MTALQHARELPVMPVVYVAGRFRGKDSWAMERNIRVAEEMGHRVAGLGAAPIIPHTMFRFFQGSLPDSFWLGATLEQMRRCDAVVLCVGWTSSAGSRAEKEEAERLGLPVFEDVDGGLLSAADAGSDLSFVEWLEHFNAQTTIHREAEHVSE